MLVSVVLPQELSIHTQLENPHNSTTFYIAQEEEEEDVGLMASRAQDCSEGLQLFHSLPEILINLHNWLKQLELRCTRHHNKAQQD